MSTTPSPHSREPKVLALRRRMLRLPVVGERIFDIVFARMAPYFSTVRPHFTRVEPNHVELVIGKRRRVHNHIGTVHVIAICNGLEAAMGCLAEVTVPADKRWIPRGMQVTYPAKADSDITCIATTEPAAWVGDDPALPVTVRAVRADGTVVVEGTIDLWVTPRKPR
ncbi:hotdog fold domain-containing protein [Aestuariimicrobium ganziense]|uniref:hotdog fold domain-containing protein n=1 Tax=Aestuariimicrobium ganziense TaxID=2773677 RepID=UPI001944A03D|nr:hotdog fold domain-containing protein [Aestuariimicrobium ganziense]